MNSLYITKNVFPTAFALRICTLLSIQLIDQQFIEPTNFINTLQKPERSSAFQNSMVPASVAKADWPHRRLVEHSEN